MDQSEETIYGALKQHVTGLFRIYTEFQPDRPFRVSLENGGTLLCEVVDQNTEQGYSSEYIPIYIIFKCGVLFFKLEGYKDSYGGFEWDHYMTEVNRQEKVVYLYE